MDATVILAENFEQSGRKHHVTILPPFAVLDVNDHSFTVDRGRRQFDGLGDSQTRRVADGQDHPVLPVLDGVENRLTSSGLITTGNSWGLRQVGTTCSRRHSRWSV